MGVMNGKLDQAHRIRIAALDQARKHVDTHNAGYMGAGTVLAFAEYFEGYITTGETDLDKLKPGSAEEEEDSDA